MGFFTKLVGFIKNRTSFKKEIEPVPFISLSGWVKEQQDKIRLHSGIDEDLKNYFLQLDEICILLDKKLIEMEGQASLWEKKDKELGKQLDSSVKKVIEILQAKERPSIDSVFQFNERLGERIDKSLLLLDKQETVSEEIDCCESLILFKQHLAANIHQLLDFRQAFEVKLFKSGLRTVQTLSQKLEMLHTGVMRRDKLQQKLKEKTERLESAKIKKKEKEAVLTELKTHPLYQRFSQVQDRKNQLQSQLYEYLDEVKLLFLHLNSVLLSYKRMGSNLELLNSYIDDPASAFVHDEGLSVVHLLEHVRAVIQQEKIHLDEEELQLIQSALDKATSSYLGNLQQQCFLLKQQLESFDVNSNVDMTFSLKVQDGQYRFTHFAAQTERLADEIGQLEEELKEKKERIRREQQMFENLVRIGLQREIKIVM